MKKTCLNCGKVFANSSFYVHRNPLISDELSFCKKCVKEKINLDDMDTFVGFLQTMNIPYVKDYWKSANNAPTETIGTYFKNLNSLPQLKELTFKDSDPISGKTNKAELTDIANVDFEVTDGMLKKWGRRYAKDDIIKLEEIFDSFGGNEAENTIQAKLYENMAKTQMIADKALEEDNPTQYEKMMKILSTQMNDANIKPVQIKSASEDGSINSWGEWVKKIEEVEPIEDGEKDYEPKYIRDYVKRWYVTQVQRVFGKIKDEDIEKLEGEDE